MSKADTKWKISKIDHDKVADIAFDLEIPKCIAGIYLKRNIENREQFNKFVNTSLDNLHDPFLLPDINIALDRLIDAINKKEKIHIHSDYDVDGITACALLVTAIKPLTKNISYYTPHRINDGYDLKVATIEKAKKENIKLLITTDCGSLAFDAIDKAREYNIDVIVMDHHTPHEDKELKCFAFINPNRKNSKYPFRELCGCGIAFKFAIALYERLNLDKDKLIDDTIEYACLGTIADVVPVLDENRSIVQNGLEALASTKKPGIKQLLKVANINKVDTTSVAFYLAPRINAIGRMADSGIALDLMLAKSNSTAEYLANQLDASNRHRQKQQDQILIEAEALLPKDIENHYVFLICAKGWHPGVVGIVAGKIAEKYGRPTLVGTINDNGVVKGSCRSIPTVNILNILKSKSCSKYFTNFGGHAFAAGFELKQDNVESLRIALNEEAQKQADSFDFCKIINVDFPVIPYDINDDVYNYIMQLSPFGKDNEEPIFLVKNLKIITSEIFGVNKNHLKLKFEAGKYKNQWVFAIAWGYGEHYDLYKPDSIVDVVFSLDRDSFNGRNNLMMVVKDIKFSGESYDK